jgi:hypothetical protein
MDKYLSVLIHVIFLPSWILNRKCYTVSATGSLNVAFSNLHRNSFIFRE